MRLTEEELIERLDEIDRKLINLERDFNSFKWSILPPPYPPNEYEKYFSRLLLQHAMAPIDFYLLQPTNSVKSARKIRFFKL